MNEVDFQPVDDGMTMPICVRYGNERSGYWLHVVDGGFTDTSDARHIETNYGHHYKINHMVLSRVTTGVRGKEETDNIGRPGLSVFSPA
jgi:hypothetical protein